jgi:hypothetical protein
MCTYRVRRASDESVTHTLFSALTPFQAWGGVVGKNKRQSQVSPRVLPYRGPQVTHERVPFEIKAPALHLTDYDRSSHGESSGQAQHESPPRVPRNRPCRCRRTKALQSQSLRKPSMWWSDRQQRPSGPGPTNTGMILPPDSSISTDESGPDFLNSDTGTVQDANVTAGITMQQLEILEKSGLMITIRMKYKNL